MTTPQKPPSSKIGLYSHITNGGTPIKLNSSITDGGMMINGASTFTGSFGHSISSQNKTQDDQQPYSLTASNFNKINENL